MSNCQARNMGVIQDSSFIFHFCSFANSFDLLFNVPLTHLFFIPYYILHLSFIYTKNIENTCYVLEIVRQERLTILVIVMSTSWWIMEVRQTTAKLVNCSWCHEENIQGGIQRLTLVCVFGECPLVEMTFKDVKGEKILI